MAGISSKAAGGLENKKKFNAIELNSGFDLNMYDAFYRNLDPQIGRFWQIDPKPNAENSLFMAMNNNPILYNDLLGDTSSYGDNTSRGMVQKFSSQTIINKKGIEVKNKHYNEAFAKVIARLDASVDNFEFSYDASATEGSVTYNGSKVIIKIADPGAGYGTDNGAEGILFEETKHAEQVLDGKAYFAKNANGTWGTATNIQNEVEAKTFVSDNLSINRTYTETSSGANFQVPTQLGYMKYNVKTDIERQNFLLHGISGLSVRGDNNRTSPVNIPAAYPTLNNLPPLFNTLSNRLKTDSFFGYPRL